MTPQKIGTKFVGFAAILLSLALFGCAERPAGPESNTQHSLITFGRTDGSSAKVLALPGTGRVTSGLFDKAGGSLKIGVEIDHPATGVALAKAEAANITVGFSVPEGALFTTEKITMTVFGDGLPGLAVGFAPGGLEFVEAATLRIRIDRSLVDERILEKDGSILGFHHHDDGTIEEADIVKSGFDGNSYIVVIRVPGFSRYSLGE
ncbi:MAG: hypothetical protein HN559_05845 [Gemmatimonadetes bacterium]|jgi:hypothetical protein|nr:hypothetical protein [Gemmatimonadota bacterium]MBT5142708.1 hypothetical protein [Gemmatimonadota bacterium]MBT5587684.1 hypothetical protein [Gemmatimonadota bacterium]MBT5960606.1 hypothetical protein [Gemmatimonadota bacterium]MBT6629798.1 hypothetical protein [Gemmatimonadota bacterium]